MTQVSNVNSMAHPTADRTRTMRRRLPLSVTLALALLVPTVGGAAILGGWAWQRFGSASAAAAFLRGEAMWIEPLDIDLGPVALDEERNPTLRASNLTGRTITLLGMKGFCTRNGCLGPSGEFPIDLAPWSTRELAIHVQAPKGRGYPLQLDTPLYTSIGSREITVSGEVQAADTASSRP